MLAQIHSSLNGLYLTFAFHSEGNYIISLLLQHTGLLILLTEGTTRNVIQCIHLSIWHPLNQTILNV